MFKRLIVFLSSISLYYIAYKLKLNGDVLMYILSLILGSGFLAVALNFDFWKKYYE